MYKPRMRRVGCPVCDTVRWVRKQRIRETLLKTGELPCCDGCSLEKRGRKTTTGNGAKRLPCPKCKRLRWVPRRNAKKLCRKCKVGKRPGRKPKRAYPVITFLGSGNGYPQWNLICPCGVIRGFTNTPPKDAELKCPKCGKLARKEKSF